ncbi:hypothetical protein FRB93_013376 [Tulasnella sp. JGI-2019a]|nr:hypothetical protein FRB93_013376 [Tulasnella sp. JGI-2019a]
MSAPSSPVDSLVELLEHDKLEDDGDLQSKLELAERDNLELLVTLKETQTKLEDLETKHRKLVGANEELTQWRDEMELQRKEWVAMKTKFAKRHLEDKIAKKELETKCSTSFDDLCKIKALYTKAEEEVVGLKGQIAVLSSSTPGVPNFNQVRCGSWSPHLNGFDECIVLSVEGQLFYVSRRLLQRDSQYFEEILKLGQGAHIGETGAKPIALDGVTVEEMCHFLTLVYAPPFQTNFDHMDVRQWAAILKLANLWSLKATKACAIAMFDTRFADENCFDRLERAFVCGVSKWVRPAYDTMCRRQEPLSANEGRQLGWDRYAAICCIREQIAYGTLDAPVGRHDYLSNFSEDFPILRPTSAKSNLPPSVIIGTAGCEPDLPGEAESVSKDGPGNTDGTLRVKHEQDVIANYEQSKNVTVEVDRGCGCLEVSLPPSDGAVRETHGPNSDGASQTSPQQQDHNPMTTASTLYHLGDKYRCQRRYNQALDAFDHALRRYQQLDDRPRIARCLNMIGECNRQMPGGSDEARTAYVGASNMYLELGDRREVAQCFRMVGEVERGQKQYEAAVSAYTEAYKLFLELDDLLGVARNLSMIGEYKRWLPGRSDEAQVAYREASQFYEGLGDRKEIACCMSMVGACQRMEGRYGEALEAYREASEVHEGIGDRPGAERCQSMIAECQRMQGYQRVKE